MREILFRGKTRTGKWVQGDYEHFEADGITYPMISVWGEFHKDVIRETVGQYTGLTDKNGKKIFEGDIVTTNYKLGRGGYYTFEVYYNENLCQFALTINSGSYTKNKQYDWLQLTALKAKKIEVIGNIHDNPKLLKGDKSDA
jgi:uncharacterized phage protein (TIGR01671 family)